MEPTTYRHDAFQVLFPRKGYPPGERERLKASIEEQGQLQPVTLGPVRGQLVLADGHCRADVLKELGRDVIGVVDPRLDSVERILAAIMDTEVRSRRNPVDVALYLRAYQRQHGLTQKQTAARLGKSESEVSRTLGLLDYPDDVVQLLADDRLTPAHTLAVKGLPRERAVEFLRRAAREGVTGVELKAAARPRPGRRPKMATLALNGCVLSYPPDMSVERFEAVLAEMKTAVSGRLKDLSKKSLKLAEVAG